MTVAVVRAAKARLNNQKHLGKGGGAEVCQDKACTCVGLALHDAGRVAGLDLKGIADLEKKFLAANNLPGVDHSSYLAAERIYEWNDLPETTLAEAVAALDKLIDYLGTEGEG